MDIVGLQGYHNVNKEKPQDHRDTAGSHGYHRVTDTGTPPVSKETPRGHRDIVKSQGCRNITSTQRHREHHWISADTAGATKVRGRTTDASDATTALFIAWGHSRHWIQGYTWTHTITVKRVAH